MSGECKVVVLYARQDADRVKTQAVGNTWILTGEDPKQVMLTRSGVPRRFPSAGNGVTWLFEQMNVYNENNPTTLVGYDVHYPNGNLRILRPGQPVVAQAAKAKPDATPKTAKAKKVAPPKEEAAPKRKTKKATPVAKVTEEAPTVSIGVPIHPKKSPAVDPAPATTLQTRFGPHEWELQPDPTNIREGFSAYTCAFCGMRVRTPHDQTPGIVGTCSRNPIEEGAAA